MKHQQTQRPAHMNRLRTFRYTFQQDPYRIKEDGTLEPWPRYTTDTDVLLYSETIATIVTPTEEIKKKYETVTK